MPDTRRFEFHVTKELDARIDAWRRQHPDLPDRSKAARLLIQQGIDADTAPEEPSASMASQAALAAPPPAKPLKDPPWRAATIRPGRTVACNVQIDEALSAKMKWLLKQNERVKREFVEAALNEYVAAEMAKLGVKP